MILLYHLLIIALALPVGLWIAWLARDELVSGRKWLLLLSTISALGAIIYFMLFGAKDADLAAGFSIIFIGIIAYIGYVKSFDRMWTKK